MPGAVRKVKVLVLFHSSTGNTFRLAQALIAGAQRVAGSEVALKRVPEILDERALLAHEHIGKSFAEFRDIPRASPEDTIAHDVIIFGAPTRLGSMSGEMKHFIDRLGPLWTSGAFRNKVG